MRVLIDTNIFVYLALDTELLSKDVAALLQEPDTLIYISAESVRELVVAYRNKGLCSKRWKSAEEKRGVPYGAGKLRQNLCRTISARVCEGLPGGAVRGYE